MPKRPKDDDVEKKKKVWLIGWLCAVDVDSRDSNQFGDYLRLRILFKISMKFNLW